MQVEIVYSCYESGYYAEIGDERTGELVHTTHVYPTKAEVRREIARLFVPHTEGFFSGEPD